MSNPTPKPATPAEVSLFIESIGGLIPRRELFPAYRPTVSDGWTWHDCTRCDGVFLESELCEVTGFCAECNARLDGAITIVDDEEGANDDR